MLARLRAATGETHARVEASLRLTDEPLDRDRYARILARLHGFWRGWEPRVAALLADEAFLAPRRRRHLLAADLAALGHAPDATQPCPPPVLGSEAEAWGSLYVMEGSTLGGRSMLPHLERQLGLRDGFGCSYFAGYGPATGRMWRAFLSRLEAQPTDHADAIVAGAIATFDRLEVWVRGV